MSYAVYADNGATGEDHQRNLLAICATKEAASTLAHRFAAWFAEWPQDEDGNKLLHPAPRAIVWGDQAPLPVALTNWSPYSLYTFDGAFVRDWAHAWTHTTDSEHAMAFWIPPLSGGYTPTKDAAQDVTPEPLLAEHRTALAEVTRLQHLLEEVTMRATIAEGGLAVAVSYLQDARQRELACAAHTQVDAFLRAHLEAFVRSHTVQVQPEASA